MSLSASRATGTNEGSLTPAILIIDNSRPLCKSEIASRADMEHSLDNSTAMSPAVLCALAGESRQ